MNKLIKVLFICNALKFKVLSKIFFSSLCHEAQNGLQVKSFSPEQSYPKDFDI